MIVLELSFQPAQIEPLELGVQLSEGFRSLHSSGLHQG
mgnify:CR=1 FL=1